MNYSSFNDFLSHNSRPQPFAAKKTIPLSEPSIDPEPEQPAPHQIEPTEVPNAARKYVIPKKLDIRTVVIDSRDRDTVKWPDSNQFQVQVGTGPEHVGAFLLHNLKNITQISLSECVVPNFTADHPYLVLRIPELRDDLDGTSDRLRSAFAILIPERAHGDYITCKIKHNFFQRDYAPPLASLTHFTIEYFEPGDGGKLYEFTGETCVALEFHMMSPDKSILGYELV